MGILTLVPPEQQPAIDSKKHKARPDSPKRRRKPSKPKLKPEPKQPSSWDQFKNLLTCKQVEGSRVHDPAKSIRPGPEAVGYSKIGSSCGSMCSFRDVVHGTTRVVHRSDSSSSPESSSLGQEARFLSGRAKSGSNNIGSVSSRSFATSTLRSSAGGTTHHSVSSRGMPLRKLSGCYECHMIVDPSRYPIIPRSTVSTCSECGEIFPKIESLEHHQAVRHAVSELGPEDSGRNIVEIIFKSSWLKKDRIICKIERILKVHNTQRTIQRFEDCRDLVKLRANSNTKKNPRCAADGNELLRFHCTTLTCSLGARGSSSLCGSVPGCGVCTIIRHGFQGSKGVRTTASSGRAHDYCLEGTEGRRAMLVCRVIAGRVRRSANDAPAEQEIISPAPTPGLDGTYDSVGGSPGVYSNLEELVVFNPRAILPCFVVIYNTLTVA